MSQDFFRILLELNVNSGPKSLGCQRLNNICMCKEILIKAQKIWFVCSGMYLTCLNFVPF